MVSITFNANRFVCLKKDSLQRYRNRCGHNTEFVANVQTLMALLLRLPPHIHEPEIFNSIVFIPPLLYYSLLKFCRTKFTHTFIYTSNTFNCRRKLKECIRFNTIQCTLSSTFFFTFSNRKLKNRLVAFFGFSSIGAIK